MVQGEGGDGSKAGKDEEEDAGGLGDALPQPERSVTLKSEPAGGDGWIRWQLILDVVVQDGMYHLVDLVVVVGDGYLWAAVKDIDGEGVRKTGLSPWRVWA
ncbi:hypothetical protein MCOR02_011224 [Pyricularia oryzae]|nr:hypothetical protein MCOR02_011224 [Pyricularia oryzae]